MKADELEALVAKARKKDETALAALCEHYYPKLLKYMRYRVGPRDAEDLAGDVMTRLLRHIHRQKGRFEPWLYRMARNVVIDRVRYTTARPQTEWNEEVMEHVHHGSDTGGAIAQRMDVEAALAELTDEQREFLTLKFMQGLSNAEIGQVTGRKPGALRALQFRALAALRDVMAGEGAAYAT